MKVVRNDKYAPGQVVLYVSNDSIYRAVVLSVQPNGILISYDEKQEVVDENDLI